MTQHADIYERITAAIIEAIEAGCGKFEMPWHTFGVMPSNANTHRRYRGINTLVLWAAAAKHGYQTNLWATYQQWSEVGAQVRKGAKSTTVVFWKFYGEEREADETSAEASKDEAHSRCFARAYSVFNADQPDPCSFECRGTSVIYPSCAKTRKIHRKPVVGTLRSCPLFRLPTDAAHSPC